MAPCLYHLPLRNGDLLKIHKFHRSKVNIFWQEPPITFKPLYFYSAGRDLSNDVFSLVLQQSFNFHIHRHILGPGVYSNSPLVAQQMKWTILRFWWLFFYSYSIRVTIIIILDTYFHNEMLYISVVGYPISSQCTCTI